MDPNGMKKHKKWPSLETLIQESKRIKQETYIDKLLKPIDQLDLGSDSDVSEIADVFEEFHRESFLRKQAGDKKYLSKHEADIKTMERFTDDYKRVMDEMRKTLKLDNKLCIETLEDIQNYHSKPKVVPDTSGIKQNIIIENQIKPIPSLSTYGINSTASSESGVWKVLEAHADPKKFFISPPGYNAFYHQKHWLERPEVTWQEINDSKLKCEKWLDTIDYM